MDTMIERVARAIDPETFNLPRINLYRSDYERAYAKARAALQAIDPASTFIHPVKTD